MDAPVLPHAAHIIYALVTVQAAIDMEQTDLIVASIIDRLAAATSR